MKPVGTCYVLSDLQFEKFRLKKRGYQKQVVKTVQKNQFTKLGRLSCTQKVLNNLNSLDNDTSKKPVCYFS